MADAQTTFFRPWHRWLIGLMLPCLLLAGLLCSLVWLEYREQPISRWLGHYLLERNAGRETRGSVWQGILASRQTRSQLQNTQALPQLELATLPPAILGSRYSIVQRSENHLILQAARRRAPLDPQRLSGAQMQELARSLQIYEQGKRFLGHISLPRDPFRVHAHIRAQLALEDGSLFPILHRKLLDRDAPEAWDFVRMSAADSRSWREYLDPFLSLAADEDGQAYARAPQVVETLRGLVKTWEDSLLAAEIDHLRDAWDASSRFQLRIVRNLDSFTGHAVPAGELPVSFDIPARKAEVLLGLALPSEDAP